MKFIPKALKEKLKKLEQKEREELSLFVDMYLSEILPEDKEAGLSLLTIFIDKVEEEMKFPRPFDYFHKAERSPFDYYQFGLDLIRPLIDFDTSKCHGITHLEKAASLLSLGDNVIFAANHQIEPDPQVISLLLSDNWQKLTQEMIFIAGHKVVQDPLARPFSRGRNLLTVYSKKHILSALDEKEERLLHNQKTLANLQALLNKGGKAIYVAMSGGRDRPDSEGKIIPAPFDASSLELFFLHAKEAKKKTHFFPMALYTYNLFPPPNMRHKDLGEPRATKRSPAHIAFGPEIFLEELAPVDIPKKKAREVRAEKATSIVRALYSLL